MRTAQKTPQKQTPEQQRSRLNRVLYNACRKWLSARGGNPTEDDIRGWRHTACRDATRELRGQAHGEGDYKLLSLRELTLAIKYAEGRRAPKTYASEQARGKLYYHALYAAIYYTDFSSVRARSALGKNIGQIVEGEALRRLLFALFQQRNGNLPNNFFVLLCEKYLNEKFNQYLHEGKLREQSHTPNYFYVAEMTAEECTYLTKRFKQIHKNLPPMAGVSEISKN